jgi:hypothetical protein
MALGNFSWVIPGKLAGSALPGGRPGAPDDYVLSDLRDLHHEGVRCLISLQAVPERFGVLCGQVGLEWVNFPVEDFETPSDIEAFEGMVGDAIARVERDEGVCVHCRAGVGRTGLALACIVGALYGIPGHKAISTVQKNRPAIDTPEQAAFVSEFCARYQEARRTVDGGRKGHGE